MGASDGVEGAATPLCLQGHALLFQSGWLTALIDTGMHADLVCVLLPVCTVASHQAVYLKTNESVALPVYQVLPDQPTKITAAAAATQEQ